MVLTGTPHATNPLVFEARQLFASCVAAEFGKAGLQTKKSAAAVDKPLQPVSERLSEMNEELQARHKESFAEIEQRLPAHQAFSEDTLRDVGRELFRSGINWGRIIAFFAFASQMALVGRRKGIHDAEEDVTLWTCQVVSTELVPWLSKQEGGWKALLQHFGPPRQRRWLTAFISRHFFLAVTVGLLTALGGLGLTVITSP